MDNLAAGNPGMVYPPPSSGICSVHPFGSPDYQACMSVNYPDQPPGFPSGQGPGSGMLPASIPAMTPAAPPPVAATPFAPMNIECQTTSTRTDDPKADSSTTTTTSSCRQ
jgi:hypothetical protein